MSTTFRKSKSYNLLLSFFFFFSCDILVDRPEHQDGIQITYYPAKQEYHYHTWHRYDETWQVEAPLHVWNESQMLYYCSFDEKILAMLSHSYGGTNSRYRLADRIDHDRI